MTYKNKCEFKKICPWVNGKLRRCGFLTDKAECTEYSEFSSNYEFVRNLRNKAYESGEKK